MWLNCQGIWLTRFSCLYLVRLHKYFCSLAQNFFLSLAEYLHSRLIINKQENSLIGNFLTVFEQANHNLLIYSWAELRFNFSLVKCLLVVLFSSPGVFRRNSNYKFTDLLNINGDNLHVLQQILSTFTNCTWSHYSMFQPLMGRADIQAFIITLFYILCWARKLLQNFDTLSVLHACYLDPQLLGKADWSCDPCKCLSNPSEIEICTDIDFWFIVSAHAYVNQGESAY